MRASPRAIPEPRLLRAQRRLRDERLRAPSTGANRARNAGAELGRHRRWTPVRDAAWRLIDRRLGDGDSVAIVGAGNGDTVPLRRIAARASAVALIDVDERAIARARRRVPLRTRGRVQLVGHDITAGAADAIAGAAASGLVPARPVVSGTPLPGAPYDLVIGDLFYSQLLYPALEDLGVAAARASVLLDGCGEGLTLAAVTRLQASASSGCVIHLHDPLAWWPGHAQPVTLAQILAAARAEPGGAEAALALAARGDGPRYSDPRGALRTLGIPVAETAVWAWPFGDGVDYLVAATVTGRCSPA